MAVVGGRDGGSWSPSRSRTGQATRPVGAHHSARLAARRGARLAALCVAITVTAACQATSVPGLNIRARATTTSPVIGSISEAGTRVGVICSVRGASILGNDLWYRISTPRRGYVASYYIRADKNTPTVPSC